MKSYGDFHPYSGLSLLQITPCWANPHQLLIAHSSIAWYVRQATNAITPITIYYIP